MTFTVFCGRPSSVCQERTNQSVDAAGVLAESAALTGTARTEDAAIKSNNESPAHCAKRIVSR
jgi:hypothetical protein